MIHPPSQCSDPLVVLREFKLDNNRCASHRNKFDAARDKLIANMATPVTLPLG
jgi:hypothetical protein